MNETRDSLDPWLAAARADLAGRMPPGWIEPALAARRSERLLLRRLRADRPAPTAPRRRWRLAPWVAVPVGLAAMVALGAALVFLRTEPPATPRGPAFVALTPLETIAAEPRPVVIASDVPRAQLAALGLPVDPARADLPVRAEFLVSQRGAVLAVRFSPE